MGSRAGQNEGSDPGEGWCLQRVERFPAETRSPVQRRGDSVAQIPKLYVQSMWYSGDWEFP
jgi:hypothetical protein